MNGGLRTTIENLEAFVVLDISLDAIFFKIAGVWLLLLLS